MRFYYSNNQSIHENIWRFIQCYWEENEMGPSVRDIAKAIQVSSPDTAQKHLDRMVNKGLVKRMTSGHRTIRVVPGSMPQHCHHFWKVVKIEGEILTVLCLWCNHKTEKEYTLDTENTKTLLRYYE